MHVIINVGVIFYYAGLYLLLVHILLVHQDQGVTKTYEIYRLAHF